MGGRTTFTKVIICQNLQDVLLTQVVNQNRKTIELIKSELYLIDFCLVKTIQEIISILACYNDHHVYISQTRQRLHVKTNEINFRLALM